MPSASYKSCYFSRAWSPSATPLPPLLPDPQPNVEASGQRQHEASLVDEDAFADDAAMQFGDGADGGDEDTASFEGKCLCSKAVVCFDISFDRQEAAGEGRSSLLGQLNCFTAVEQANQCSLYRGYPRASAFGTKDDEQTSVCQEE